MTAETGGGPRVVIISSPEAPEAPDRLQRRENEVLLDTMRRLGWTGAYACRRGGCGECLVRVHRGAVEHGPHTQRALSSEDERAGHALACRARPTTPEVEIEFLKGEARQYMPILSLMQNKAKER